MEDRVSSGLIGVTGRARAGKDSFAARLVEAHGFTRVAFADPIRDFALTLDPLVDGHYRLSEIVRSLGWDVAKESIPEVRRTLQRLGTEAGRNVLGDRVWIDAALGKIDAVDGPVVVTDVRFPNEAEAITSAGGILVRVVRPGHETADAHPSETAMDGYPVHVQVVNDGSLEQLWAAADWVAGDA